MKRKAFFNIFFIFSLIFLVSCKKESVEKYDIEFFNTFDTVTHIIIYDSDSKRANKELETMHNRFNELHKIYDKYNDYEGLNNLKTINDNAGIEPVKVDKELFYLIEYSLDSYKNISNKTNIAMGPVVDTWNKYRELYEAGKTKEEVVELLGSEIPTKKELDLSRQYLNVDDIVLNKEDQTVYLKKTDMQLDVGSVAKGYATELVAKEAEERGVKSAIISAGGNVRAIGGPIDRDYYSVAVQNPYKNSKEEKDFLTVLKIKGKSVVTSGDYQRYFKVDDKNYCHIIDPESLMPGNIYRSVSVITEDSLLCDYLSTSLFLMPYEEGRDLADKLNVDVIWAFPNGEVKVTDGAKKLMVEQ